MNVWVLKYRGNGKRANARSLKDTAGKPILVHAYTKHEARSKFKKTHGEPCSNKKSNRKRLPTGSFVSKV